MGAEISFATSSMQCWSTPRSERVEVYLSDDAGLSRATSNLYLTITPAGGKRTANDAVAMYYPSEHDRPIPIPEGWIDIHKHEPQTKTTGRWHVRLADGRTAGGAFDGEACFKNWP